MKNMTISVIVPCYNGAKYVRRCLDCIGRQTRRPDEVILIDDGSTDDSAELAGEYPWVTLVQNDQNRGLSYTRNRGIQLAKGDYLHFMDIDDKINSRYYELLERAVLRSDAEMAFSELINEAKPQYSQSFKKEQSHTSVRAKFRATYVAKMGYACRYLIKRELILRHELEFPVGRYIEDLPFSVKAVYYATAIVVVPGAEYLYLLNASSILNKPDPQHQAEVNRGYLLSQAEVKAFAKEKGFRLVGKQTGVIPYFLRKVKRKYFGPFQRELTEELEKK
ncbi:MAG: glycosyltransferase [Porphyromonas sp.]|nr:glycosyltransferase [Porphyromonas sp.]